LEDCEISGPRFEWYLTGTTDDGGGDDDYGVELVDGNGVRLNHFSSSVPVGILGVASGVADLGGITARPITIRIIDEPGGTVVDSDTIDPARFVHDCSRLPLVGRRDGGTSDDDDDPGPPFIPGDDRLNVDAAAPVSIYCRDDGIHVYSIDRFGTGRLAFIATFNEINAVGTPLVNTLIDSGAGIGLFRLTTGEFQVNSTRASSGQPKRLALQEQGEGPIIHVVQQGETLFRLAIRYRTTVQAIAAANGIADVTRIYVGQRLIIPVGSVTPGTTSVIPPAPSQAGIGAGYVFIFNGC
jgi:hypothetical protein